MIEDAAKIIPSSTHSAQPPARGQAPSYQAPTSTDIADKGGHKYSKRSSPLEPPPALPLAPQVVGVEQKVPPGAGQQPPAASEPCKCPDCSAQQQQQNNTGGSKATGKQQQQPETVIETSCTRKVRTNQQVLKCDGRPEPPVHIIVEPRSDESVQCDCRNCQFFSGWCCMPCALLLILVVLVFWFASRASHDSSSSSSTSPQNKTTVVVNATTVAPSTVVALNRTGSSWSPADEDTPDLLRELGLATSGSPTGQPRDLVGLATRAASQLYEALAPNSSRPLRLPTRRSLD